MAARSGRLPYEELARILEVPLGTVRSRLFAAREQLRRVWNGSKQGDLK